MNSIVEKAVMNESIRFLKYIILLYKYCQFNCQFDFLLIDRLEQCVNICDTLNDYL